MLHVVTKCDMSEYCNSTGAILSKEHSGLGHGRAELTLLSREKQPINDYTPDLRQILSILNKPTD